MLYKYGIRPLLFTLDPEVLNDKSLSYLSLINNNRILLTALDKILSIKNPQILAGISFRNPVGLAAGFDVHGVAINSLAAFGFGFIEIGSVTQFAQEGNEKPRIFRNVKNQALINKMGFNNYGVDNLVQKLQNFKKIIQVPLGINLGKSKIVSLDDAVLDYCYSLKKLYLYGDYFVINVSSPNTPGLRMLQTRDYLPQLLSHIITTSKQYAEELMIKPKPIFIKIAPDFLPQELDSILDSCAINSVDGIIATNTTVDFDQTLHQGGLSGRPLFDKSLSCVRFIRKQLPTIPLIGVGGISSPEQALMMFDAGADLIQLYSALIYQGPLLIKKINRGLLQR